MKKHYFHIRPMGNIFLLLIFILSGCALPIRTGTMRITVAQRVIGTGVSR